jgi:ribonuclease P protein component
VVNAGTSKAGTKQFRRDRRVRQQRDFDNVWRTRRYAADNTLVINAAFTGPDSPTRLGLSVSRKVGNAVVRNQWKRRIREAFRTQFDELPSGLDLVVRPKAGAKPDFAAIQISLVQLARRLARQSEQRK